MPPEVCPDFIGEQHGGAQGQLSVKSLVFVERTKRVDKPGHDRQPGAAQEHLAGGREGAGALQQQVHQLRWGQQGGAYKAEAGEAKRVVQGGIGRVVGPAILAKSVTAHKRCFGRGFE